MRIRTILLLGIMLCTFQAHSINDFYLSNGSVLTGYMKYQPSSSKEKCIIEAEQAILVVPDSLVDLAGSPKFRKKDSLDKNWIDWAEKNGWMHDVKGVPGLYFSNISLKGENAGNYDDVQILKEGSVYEFVVMGERSFSVPSSHIVRKIWKPRAPEILSGINREYTVSRGGSKQCDSIVGELIEISPEKVYTVLTPTGISKTFPKSAIINENIIAINGDQPLAEQMEYKDVLVLADKDEDVEGYIIAKDYKNSMITLYIDDRHSQKYHLSKIKGYKKKKNNPKILRDVLLEKGEIRVGDVTVNKECKVVNYNDHMVLTPIDSVLTNKIDVQGTTFTVYSNLEDDRNFKEYVLVRLTKENSYNILLKVKGYRNRDKAVYDFTYKDLVENIYQPLEKSTSKNGTTKVVYRVNMKGMYALYNKRARKAIVIEVK